MKCICEGTGLKDGHTCPTCFGKDPVLTVLHIINNAKQAWSELEVYQFWVNMTDTEGKTTYIYGVKDGAIVKTDITFWVTYDLTLAFKAVCEEIAVLLLKEYVVVVSEVSRWLSEVGIDLKIC